MSKEKTAFITGIEGFAGGHLKKEMEVNGYAVSGTSLSEIESRERENIYQCDIRDKKRFVELIRLLKPGSIFHLAAFVSPSMSVNQSELARDININGTSNLFEAVRLAMEADSTYKPRIIIVGSTEEYGDLTDSTVVNEDTPKNPSNPYGQTKLQNYHLALDYIKKYNLDIVSAIPSNHTGPGQEQFLAAEIAKKIVLIENGQADAVLITGDISNKKNFSDVRDVVRAYRLLLEKGKTGERYLVCNDQNVALSDIVETLIGLSPKPIDHRVDSSKGRPNNPGEIFYSNKKIKEATGYEPSISLNKTLEDLLNYHRKKGKINQ